MKSHERRQVGVSAWTLISTKKGRKYKEKRQEQSEARTL